MLLFLNKNYCWAHLTYSPSPHASKSKYFYQNMHRMLVKALVLNPRLRLSPHFCSSRFSAVHISSKTCTALQWEHDSVSKTYFFTFRKCRKVCKTTFHFSELMLSLQCGACFWRSVFSCVLMLSPQRGAHVKKTSTACIRERDFHSSKQKNCFLTFEKCGKVCKIAFALCGFPFVPSMCLRFAFVFVNFISMRCTFSKSMLSLKRRAFFLCNIFISCLLYTSPSPRD